MTFYNLQNSLKLPPKIQKMEVSMDLDVSRAFVARFVPPPPPLFSYPSAPLSEMYS